MSEPMKAIVVRQPWATLIALGIKTIETRPGPPNGPMRPDGVRGLPGCRLERGERIAIVAGAGVERGFFPIKNVAHLGGPVTSREWRLPNGHLIDEADVPGATFPRGAVVCTVVVADALPIVPRVSTQRYGSEWDGHHRFFSAPHEGYLTRTNPRGGPATSEGVAGQLPLGDFTPGRWGWLLTDPQPCEPIPYKGRQGVFVLPDDVAGQIA